MRGIRNPKLKLWASVAVALLTATASPAHAATDFAYDGSSIASVALLGLLVGFAFCVVLAITRIALGDNKIMRAALAVGTIGLTWVAYKSAAEFPTVNARSVSRYMTPVVAVGLSADTLDQLGGGQ